MDPLLAGKFLAKIQWSKGMIETIKCNLSTIPQKLEWLENRYWRFGQDERLSDFMVDIYDVDEDGLITATPRRNPLTNETQGLMILGGTGSGKSALLNRTLRANPALTEFKEDRPGNTLFITVPPEATIKKVAEIILVKTGYKKIDNKMRASDAWEIARHRFGLVGVTTLMIDECHHILRPGPGRDVPGAIQSLKHIMQSDQGVTLVIAGVPELRDAIISETSGETHRRFLEYFLDKIPPGSEAERLFGRNFLKSAEKLGLRAEAKDAIIERILFAQGGEVGRSVTLAKEILRDAVIRKQERLSLERAEHIYRKRHSSLNMTPFNPATWGNVRADLEAMGWVQ